MTPTVTGESLLTRLGSSLQRLLWLAACGSSITTAPRTIYPPSDQALLSAKLGGGEQALPEHLPNARYTKNWNRT